MSRRLELIKERGALVTAVNLARERVEDGPGHWERRAELDGLLSEAEGELQEWDRLYWVELCNLNADFEWQGQEG